MCVYVWFLFLFTWIYDVCLDMCIGACGGWKLMFSVFLNLSPASFEAGCFIKLRAHQLSEAGLPMSSPVLGLQIHAVFSFMFNVDARN